MWISGLSLHGPSSNVGFFSFPSLFDVLVERGSCVVIYMPFITLGRKVFEIRFQLQTGVCFLSISWREKKESDSVYGKRRNPNLWKRLEWSHCIRNSRYSRELTSFF